MQPGAREQPQRCREHGDLALGPERDLVALGHHPRLIWQGRRRVPPDVHPLVGRVVAVQHLHRQRLEQAFSVADAVELDAAREHHRRVVEIEAPRLGLDCVADGRDLAVDHQALAPLGEQIDVQRLVATRRRREPADAAVVFDALAECI